MTRQVRVKKVPESLGIESWRKLKALAMIGRLHAERVVPGRVTGPRGVIGVRLSYLLFYPI